MWKAFSRLSQSRIHPEEKTNKYQWERVTTWKSALVTVCWAEGVYCGGAGSWSCQVVIQTRHWILFRWLHFIWQYQELGMADSKPVWATWRQAGKEEPPRLFVCLCWNWLHEYMMLLLRLKNYFLSISGLKEAAPSNTGWFFNWASPENVSRLAPLCFEKVLSMAAEKGEIPNT